MEEQPGLAMSSESEEAGFASAVAAFAAEEQPGAPNAVPEGDEPKAPAPEPEQPPAEPESEPSDAEAREAAADKPPEFVKFDKPEQLKRFNDVFGYAKRLERELEAVRRQQAQPVAAPTPQPAAPVATQPFLEPKPKLGDFETVELWEEKATEWMARKAAHEAIQSIRHEMTQRQAIEKQQSELSRFQSFVDGKINEGYQKFGKVAFDNMSHELVTFAPVGSEMYNTLLELPRFADVAMELGKNLQEADRISRLSARDQIFELKSLEKKLIAKEALATKAHPKLPTKVEAPGEGEDLRTKPATKKLIQAAKASGRTKDWANVFQNDQSL